MHAADHRQRRAQRRSQIRLAVSQAREQIVEGRAVVELERERRRRREPGQPGAETDTHLHCSHALPSGCWLPLARRRAQRIAEPARERAVACRVDARAGLLIRYGGDFVDGVVARASGSFVETVDGRRVLDFTAGQICATVGHNHPRVVAAIEAACREVLHLNSWMLSEPVLALADRLVGTLPEPLRRVMLLSTGGEGIEAALRMAKLSSGRFEVAALTRSWHGVTAGASTTVQALPMPPELRCV